MKVTEIHLDKQYEAVVGEFTTVVVPVDIRVCGNTTEFVCIDVAAGCKVRLRPRAFKQPATPLAYTLAVSIHKVKLDERVRSARA